MAVLDLAEFKEQQMQASHRSEVNRAIDIARGTGCKGVLLSASGKVCVTSSVGYGRVQEQDGHYQAWIEALAQPEQACTLGHTWKKPLTWRSRCEVCNMEYLSWSLDQ